jgi:hypothetical protein
MSIVKSLAVTKADFRSGWHWESLRAEYYQQNGQKLKAAEAIKKASWYGDRWAA